jgi:hypothetical protein
MIKYIYAILIVASFAMISLYVKKHCISMTDYARVFKSSEQFDILFRSLFSRFFFSQGNRFIPMKFDVSDVPLIEIEIEGSIYPVMLDLGSYTQVSLEQEILKKISKKPLGIAQFGDIKGNNYESQKYLIPEIKIGNSIFSEVIVKEENDDFKKNCVLWDYSDAIPLKRRGVIGRSLLKRQNILLDFPHSGMLFVENIDSLKDVGFSIQDMLAVPFTMTSLGIILNIETDIGTKQFLLDSGFTISVIRASQCKNISFQKDRRGCDYFSTSQFIIEGNNFANMPLHLLDLPADMNEIDGILGMNFMRHHAIYFDFRNRILYIGENDVGQLKIEGSTS